MGSKHLSDWQLKQYETRAAEPADLVEIDDHLHECDSCYERLCSLARPADRFEFRDEYLDDQAGGDPLYRYLESYVDGRLSGTDLARFERHLEKCEPCASEAEGLLELKSMISTDTAMAPVRRSSVARQPGMLESGRVRKAAWV